MDAGGADWLARHRPYDDPGSPLSRRLAAVQRCVAVALDEAPPGPLRVLSVCAGQGRDLIGPLAGHARRHDVAAVLVESDRRNLVVAAGLAEQAGLSGLQLVAGDASVTDPYEPVVPVQVALVCGVFGNISLDDIEKTVGLLPTLCAPGATVIWTRHTREPDRTVQVRRFFDRTGFDEVSFEAPRDLVFGVGAHRLVAPVQPFAAGQRLFTFTGDGHLPA